jgi:cation diffusion facilitator CzcD-associated flavoprotein CzcO
MTVLSDVAPGLATDGSTTPHVRVAVIGTGFAGLGMAIKLEEAGIDDFVLLERADDVGGTWRDNTYPGCACDVPSHLYSFSFAPNPDWTHSFSPQPEIWEYLRRCVRDHGLEGHIRFGHEVVRAAWDDASARWTVQTSGGSFTADVLVSGTGALSEPSIPDLPGLDTFEGTMFHSAHWDHLHDLAGERVGVIGTGASSVQFIPEIQPRVAHLTVFQRTPAWVVPRFGRPFSPLERRLHRRMPVTQRIARAWIYWSREALVLPFTRRPRMMRLIQRVARAHLRRQVEDESLRAKLMPDYTIGCKRILLSDDFYPALARPYVELVTEPIAEVRRRSILTADGREHPVDTIIFGTGFHVTDAPIASLVRGRDGRTLAEHWSDGMEAYRGTTVAGFPNFFMLVGPNTGLGHSSMVFVIESQVAYVMECLRAMEERGADVVEVRTDVQREFNHAVQRRMGSTIWLNGGCRSWYLDARGRNTTLWPFSSWRFRKLTQRFDEASYVMGARRRAEPRPGARPSERASSPTGS